MPALLDAAVGALCATGSALTWSVINLLVRSLSPPFNSVALNAVRSTVGSVLIVAWIAAMAGLGGLTDMSGRALWLLAISVVLAVGVGDTIFFESVKWLGLVRAMTVSMTYPLFAALLAAVVLGEAPTMQVSAGGLLTLAGLILTVRAKGGEVPVHARFRLGLAAALVAPRSPGRSPSSSSSPRSRRWTRSAPRRFGFHWPPPCSGRRPGPGARTGR